MKIEEQVLTIPQTKHLQELGLDMSDSALCWIIGSVELTDVVIQCQSIQLVSSKPEQYNWVKEVIHTYTLQEILDKLPEIPNCKKHIYYPNSIRYINYLSSDFDILIHGESLIQAAYKALCWIIKHNFI